MKIIPYKNVLAAFAILFAIGANAQVGFNNPNPDPSSVLDLTAIDKGLLIPRMTTIQRQAIGTPAQSLLVYDTNLKGFFFYQSGNWYSLNEWVRVAGSNTVSFSGNTSVTGSLSSSSVSTSSVSVPGFPVNAFVPAGVIVMWSGSIGSIPSGWALCNGGNGTPNLMDRFIVGAGSSYGPGNAGGLNTVTLTISQMPSHNHSIYDPGHRHTYQTAVPDGRGADASKASTIATGTTNLAYTGISINNNGGNGAHENRPPYYALAYIMKLP